MSDDNKIHGYNRSTVEQMKQSRLARFSHDHLPTKRSLIQGLAIAFIVLAVFVKAWFLLFAAPFVVIWWKRYKGHSKLQYTQSKVLIERLDEIIQNERNARTTQQSQQNP